MTALETLVNIGPQLAADLRFVGIDSAETLTEVGASVKVHPLSPVLPMLSVAVTVTVRRPG